MAKTTRAKKKAETKAAKNAVKKDVLSSLKPKQKEIPIQQDSIRLLQFTYQSKAAVNSKTIQAAGEQLLQNAQAKIAEFGLSAEPQVMATVLFDQSIGWQSGKFSGVNDDEIDLYKFEDQYEYEGEPLQTEYKNFNLTLKLVKTTGGHSAKNDCLWHCLNQAFRETRLPRSINLPHLLKRKLGLARTAMVSVSKLPMLSQILKVELNVVGDVEQHHNQAKDGVYTKKLTLKLHDQHYTLAKKHAIDNQLRGSTSVMDRPIVLYSEVNSADTGALSYLAYNSSNTLNSPNMRPLQRKELELFWTKPQSSKQIYRKSQFSKNFTKHCAEEYAEIQRDANQLKVSTKGLINLHRQLNETKSALFVFAKLNAMMTPPAKIGQLESTWIDAAKSGGLIWANEAPVELETACQYDINSFYPSLLTRQAFSIPVGEGTFKHIAELPPDFALYGLYKCRISSANNPSNTNKWFKFKSANTIYTHYDINVARKLGMTVTMSTASPNVLLFEDRVPARSVFKPFVDYIYDLRKTVPDATKPRVKKIMNCLWGGLCAKRKTKVDMNKVKVLDLEGRSVTHIEPFGDSILVTVERNENRYKTTYARMLPFITSYGRYVMFKELHPFKDSIHRIHTDGFIADRKLDLKLSTKLGGWKIEKQGKCRIKNSKHVEWDYPGD